LFFEVFAYIFIDRQLGEMADDGNQNKYEKQSVMNGFSG